MFTFDLKSGYHHVEIFPEHRKYLSFAWTFSSGRTRFFQIFPFGLSSAPYLFTKLLKPLVKKWRSEAKSIVVDLNDGLGAAEYMNKAKIPSLQVHADLLKSGFLPNEAKCIWDPAQVISWLGAVLNTSTSEISATGMRMTSLQEDLARLLWPFPRLVIQIVSMPLFAERSYLLAPVLVMSLRLCLEIYSQSSIRANWELLRSSFVWSSGWTEFLEI